MRIQQVSVSNWRNFTSVDFDLGDRLFVVGPNASGKSNLLDVFRFMGDIASPGGGLAAAVSARGGLGKVRSLFARNHRGGRLIIEMSLSDGEDTWIYRLAVKGEGSGRNRPFVDEEYVERNGEPLLQRPSEADMADAELLSQTHLEQIFANREFRSLAEYFAKVRYSHPIPQLMRHPVSAPADQGVPRDLIAAMNGVPERTRNAWLARIQAALQAAVPEFDSLRMETDPAGRPHLVAGYRNWRVNPTKHRETEFSDGTLRLIGLLWAIVSTPANGGLLLLEEPELSLNAAIVRHLPSMLAAAQRDRDLQVMISTHSPAILDDEGIAPHEILVLRVTENGTRAHMLSDIDEVADEVAADLPASDIVQSLIDPVDLAPLITVGRARH